MRLQIASDLHLEFYDSKPLTTDFFKTLVNPDTGADVLLLAGDIGYPERNSTKDFLAWCCQSWPHVIWVLGNHEYYLKRPCDEWKYCSQSELLSMSEKEALAENYMLTHSNLSVLANTYTVLPGLEHFRFVGTTLWTDIPDDKQAALEYYMNDFTYICSSTSPPKSFTIHTWLDQFYDAREFLQEQFAEAHAAKQEVVVITHHLPTYDLILPQYKNSPMNCGFAAHCDDLIQHPSVLAWFCGHSHGQTELQVKKTTGGECKVILNARGYKDEPSAKSYSREKVIEF